MPLAQIYKFLKQRRSKPTQASQLSDRLQEVLRRTWYYGFTGFGGPPVHFQIFYKDFVQSKTNPWLDEQMYQELFALCQGLPGPASTKFLFIVVLLRLGVVCAGLAFLLWALPGAIGMLGLALGVQRISDVLPDPVYALLSGLNASTVGVLAVAAVQLSEKCIDDSLSRILVIYGACAGLCYSALWYYPLLVVIGGVITTTWDLWLGKRLRRMKQRREACKRRQSQNEPHSLELGYELGTRENQVDQHSETSQHAPKTIRTKMIQPAAPAMSQSITNRRPVDSKIEGGSSSRPMTRADAVLSSVTFQTDTQQQSRSVSSSIKYGVSTRTGIALTVVFVASFVTIMVLRSQVHTTARTLPLFANMYLAGTIIFGGGPVVIPLLREYVVTPGWVSPRDFLIGLAIIQAFPGPNFNFAVYLGALTLSQAQRVDFGESFLGAVLGFIGIFAPGLLFAVCIQAFWRKLRTKPMFTALLRGVNATAVGLVFTAVYRLWEAGYLSKTSTNGQSLAREPWWVVVAAVAFSGHKWFGVPAAASILVGGLLGVAWWGATQT